MAQPLKANPYFQRILSLCREKRDSQEGKAPSSVALFYPNIYPVAISNLGFQLVYSLLNQQDHIVCERFVYPSAGILLRIIVLLTSFHIRFRQFSGLSRWSPALLPGG